MAGNSMSADGPDWMSICVSTAGIGCWGNGDEFEAMDCACPASEKAASEAVVTNFRSSMIGMCALGHAIADMWLEVAGMSIAMHM